MKATVNSILMSHNAINGQTLEVKEIRPFEFSTKTVNYYIFEVDGVEYEVEEDLVTVEKEMRTFGQFELIGFHVDYHINGKYVGSITLEDADREVCGYNGRIYLTADEDFTVSKGRKITKIKKGQKYFTELQALCGRRIEC